MNSETEIRYRRGYDRSDCCVAVGQIMTVDREQYRIVIRAELPVDTDQGQKPWSQEYESRPCTADEATAAKQKFRRAALKKQLRGLAGSPDDERLRTQIEAQRAKIQAELAALDD